jgi:hypothetical protein
LTARMNRLCQGLGMPSQADRAIQHTLAGAGRQPRSDFFDQDRKVPWRPAWSCAGLRRFHALRCYR